MNIRASLTRVLVGALADLHPHLITPLGDAAMTECAAQRALRAIGVFLDEPEALGDVPSLLAAIQRQVERADNPLGPFVDRVKADPVQLAMLGSNMARTVMDVLDVEAATAALDSLMRALRRRLRRRKVPADASRLVQSLRETSLELELELGRMALSDAAANDSPALEVERLALAIAEAAILIALSARATAARASTLPSAGREER